MRSFKINNQLLNSLMNIIFLLFSCDHLLTLVFPSFSSTSEAGFELIPPNSLNFKTTHLQLFQFLYLFQLFQAISASILLLGQSNKPITIHFLVYNFQPIKKVFFSYQIWIKSLCLTSTKLIRVGKNSFFHIFPQRFTGFLHCVSLLQ